MIFIRSSTLSRMGLAWAGVATYRLMSFTYLMCSASVRSPHSTMLLLWQTRVVIRKKTGVFHFSLSS